MRVLKLALLAFALVYLLPTALALLVWKLGDHPATWAGADWTSARLLPAPSAAREAAVYVFSARTGGLKGAVSEHSWIVVKDRDAPAFERWDKVGWGAPVRRNAYPPDGRWYSNPPRLVAGRRGEAAEAIIPLVRAAIRDYPFAAPGGYRIFPGPNSNTFTEHVLRRVPALGATLPTVSVGRDFPSNGRFAEFDAARGDLRLSLLGWFGVTVGRTSGFEANVLGLVAGLDFKRLGVKIPAFGTVALLPERGAEA